MGNSKHLQVLPSVTGQRPTHRIKESTCGAVHNRNRTGAGRAIAPLRYMKPLTGAALLSNARSEYVHSTSSLAAKGDITVDTALVAVGAALGSNLVVKTVLAIAAGGRRFGWGFFAGMAIPATVFSVALAVAVTTV